MTNEEARKIADTIHAKEIKQLVDEKNRLLWIKYQLEDSIKRFPWQLARIVLAGTRAN